jgi:hypothetical protein
MFHSYLQTKAVSLALEAKYIRKQERRFVKKAKVAKLKGRTFSAEYFDKNREGQYLHRISVVRDEARATNIARGFLRDHSYAEIETTVHSKPNWERVEDLVFSYAERNNPKYNRSVEDRYGEWKKAALLHLIENKVAPPKADTTQYGYMEPGSEYQQSLRKRRA